VLEGDFMLTEIAADLTRAVDGIDWDASRVEVCCQRLVRESRLATPSEILDALDLLVDRLARATVDDADGVAHVAISAGTLVERGGPARRLGETLLGLAPAVLIAARRYADRCLAAMGPDSDDDAEGAEEDAVAYVDDRAIPRAIFRAGLDQDRPGAAALACLRQWTLPTVASLTRDRDLLHRAVSDARFSAAAEGLRRSEASWLHVLTGVQLEAPWMVLFPMLERGFRIVVDGVVSNFDLHALLADLLMPRGIPGTSNPPDVIAVIRGESSECRRNYVAGSWNLYSYRAAAYDLSEARHVPHAHWVWGEGQPRDVPELDGVRTLLVGPSALERSWNAGRTFAALRAQVEVREELSPNAVHDCMRRFAETPS
jgi:hypothetical protein